MQAVVLSVVPLAFLVALLVISALFQRAAEQEAVRAGISTRVLSESDGLYALLAQQSRGLEALHRHPTRANLAALDAAGAELVPTLDRLGRLVAIEGLQVPRYRTYRAQTLQLEALVRQFARLAMARDNRGYAALGAARTTSARSQAWLSTRGAFDATERNAALARYDDARKQIEPYRRATFATAAVGAFVSLLLALSFGVRIARRLRALAASAQRLAAGETPPPIAGQDEIASLDAVYRELTMRLRETVEEKDAALSAYDREHRVAAMLQRALLPQDLPHVAALRIDAAYVSAGERGLVGGDWYDVFLLTDTLIGISAGDVAGHGLRAATRMSAVRQSIRTAARASDEPATVLRHVNRVLCADEEDAFVSAFFATFDQTSGELCYAVAGHPPPLLIAPDGETRLLRGEGIVLGIDPRVDFVSQRVAIELGAALVVYTDGLIEHRYDTVEGTRRLVEAARAEFFSPSANPADGIQRRVLDGEAPRDDSAVLFVSVTGQPGHTAAGSAGSKEWTFDARRETEATRVKRALLWELAGLGQAGWDLGTIEAIYGELSSNVARHTPGPARVVLERRGGTVVLHVEDRGEPFAPPPGVEPDLLAESGRGLFMIRALAANVRIERVDGGNRVSVVLPEPVAQPVLDLEKSPGARAPGPSAIGSGA